MIFIHTYVYVYPRGILIEEEYKTFDSRSTSIAFYLVVALDIVDDFKPKRNSKLRPTQSNAVIDAKLYFNVLHPLYTHCAHCIHTVNRRNDSAESACWRSRSLALMLSLPLSRSRLALPLSPAVALWETHAVAVIARESRRLPKKCAKTRRTRY